MSFNSAANPERKSFDYYIPPKDDGKRSTPSNLRKVRLTGWTAFSFAVWPILLTLGPMITGKSMIVVMALITLHFCLASGYALVQRKTGKTPFFLAGVALILFGISVTVCTTEPASFLPALTMLSDLIWLPLGIGALIYATISAYQAKHIQRKAPISAKLGILLVIIPVLYYVYVTYIHLPI